MRLVLATCAGGEIGYQGAMCHECTQDMDNFYHETVGKVVIMGFRTFDTIGKPLPNRKNIVITNREGIKGVECVKPGDLKSLYEVLLKYSDMETILIGGLQTIESLRKFITSMYLTHLNIRPIDFLSSEEYEKVLRFDKKKIFKEEYFIPINKTRGNTHGRLSSNISLENKQERISYNITDFLRSDIVSIIQFKNDIDMIVSNVRQEDYLMPETMYQFNKNESNRCLENFCVNILITIEKMMREFYSVDIYTRIYGSKIYAYDTESFEDKLMRLEISKERIRIFNEYLDILRDKYLFILNSDNYSNTQVALTTEVFNTFRETKKMINGFI